MPEHIPWVIHALLAIITALAAGGVTVSLQNRSMLQDISSKMSDVDGRTKVLEDWRLSHERWKEEQIREIKDHLTAIERGRNGS